MDDYDASTALSSAEADPADDNLDPKTTLPTLWFKAHEGILALFEHRLVFLSDLHHHCRRGGLRRLSPFQADFAISFGIAAFLG